MKKLLQNAVGPFAMFSLVLVFVGCEQASAPYSEQISPEKSQLEQQDQRSTRHNTLDEEMLDSSQEQINTTTLKSGNMFYIVRDVADLQLKAGSYVEKLNNSKADLETAISEKDSQQLQSAATTLQEQLQDFNDTLTRLNLKSQEVDQIRENILSANQQVLNSPLLNGKIDFNQIDVKKIEQQMGSIQNEMLKLAAMLISTHDQKDAQNTEPKA